MHATIITFGKMYQGSDPLGVLIISFQHYSYDGKVLQNISNF